MYYKQRENKADESIIMNAAVEIYTHHSYYGYRRIHIELRKLGFIINRKRVQRLLNKAGLHATFPGPNTSLRNQKHKVFDYLLKDLDIVYRNQAWQVDITYIKMRHGFVYLVCLIDVFSRKIMGWELSTFLDADSCVKAYQNALLSGEVPEIVNSDQGCQFTSEKWIELVRKTNAQISMDGKGRYADNIFVERFWRTIKYELVYLQSLETVEQARKAIGQYIAFYNQQRPHQTLNYHTPDAVFEKNAIPSKKDLFDSFIALNRGGQNMIPKTI
jgi:putative transposase